jgi:DNA-binding NarL/FixJ family response regulator
MPDSPQSGLCCIGVVHGLVDRSRIPCIVLNRRNESLSLNVGFPTLPVSNRDKQAVHFQRSRFRMTRILIADGNDVVRKLLKLLVESRAGWTVCGEATDGEDAQRKARELRPDLIILDLAMSGLNGLLAAREISKVLPSVPILLHTVNNIPAVVAEAKKFGIRRVIGKGGDGEVLLNAIQEELAAKPQGIAALLEETTTLNRSEQGTEAADSPKPNRPPRMN